MRSCTSLTLMRFTQLSRAVTASGYIFSRNISGTKSAFQAIAPIAKALRLAFFSSSAFHRLKRTYFIPALSIVYEREMQRVQEHAGEILRKVSPPLSSSSPSLSLSLSPSLSLSVQSTLVLGREAVSVRRRNVRLQRPFGYLGEIRAHAQPVWSNNSLFECEQASGRCVSLYSSDREPTYQESHPRDWSVLD